MSERLHDRVNEILTDADERSGSLLEAEGDDESDATTLLETAEEASDLLESAEPRELLEAVGLGTLPDGTEPETLPEAIAKGDPERVADLQRLLKLGDLADRSDDSALEGAVGDLQETIDDRTAVDADEGDESAAGDGDVDADEASAASTDDESEDLEDRLRSAVGSSLEAFGDDVESMRERLEGASAGLADDGDRTDADDSEAADDDEETDDGDDGGLLGSDDEDGPLGSDQRTGASDSSRHSTMAPPPSERADMRSPTRLSTMPDRN